MIIKYLIALIVGYFMGIFPLLISVIICRVGIKNCNTLLKEKVSDYNINVLKYQKKRYYISLLVQITIYIIITLFIYKFLRSVFYAYFFCSIITLLLNFGNSGNTSTNSEEFLENYAITKQNYDAKFNNKE